VAPPLTYCICPTTDLQHKQDEGNSDHSDWRRSTADSSVPSTDLYDPHLGVEDLIPWVELVLYYTRADRLVAQVHWHSEISLGRVSGNGNWHVATCIQADPSLIPSLANVFLGCSPSLLIPLPSQPHEPSIANTKVLILLQNWPKNGFRSASPPDPGVHSQFRESREH
jgi:hypothetical protein